jgi:acyl-CoA reductase-like NAD-dependent aldehyde dehydrogenase
VYKDTETVRIECRRAPIGVIACITPWNFPLFIAVQKIAPALAVGNTIVLKPTPYTPLSTVRLCELLVECFPRGVLNCIAGPDGQEFNVGQFLTNHPLVRKVSFTGSIGERFFYYYSVVHASAHVHAHTHTHTHTQTRAHTHTHNHQLARNSLFAVAHL